jgi:predicted PurR-regulated permease PerM
MSKAAAVGAVYGGVVVMLLAAGVLLVPAVIAQLIQLGSNLPTLARDLQASADQLHADLVERGLPEAQLTDIYRNAISRAETAGTALLTNTVTWVTAFVGSVLRATLVLILSFYIMLDGDKIGNVIVGLLPVRYRDGAATAFEQIDRTFGGFVRGQLVQASIYAFGTWFVMELAGLPYALVISIFAGVAMAIPIIGPYLAMGPPVILAFIVAPETVWWVFGLLFALQFVVVNVIAPRIMSRAIGVHPLVVFAAVLIGAELAQGWGAIFGVPIAAVLYLVARAFYMRVVLHMPLYRKGAPLSPDALVPPAAEVPPSETVPGSPAESPVVPNGARTGGAGAAVRSTAPTAQVRTGVVSQKRR